MVQGEVEKILIEGRNKLAMTGVTSVDGFSDTTLKLTVGANKVFISGEKIKITAFNKGNGNLSADGVFNEIKYNYKKPTLVKRIFK